MTPAELTTAREALHLSQVELSRVLGVHPNIINRWERGRAKIPPYLNWAILAISRGRSDHRMNVYVFEGSWEAEVIAANSEEEAWQFLASHEDNGWKTLERLRDDWKVGAVFDLSAMAATTCIAHYSG